MTPVELIAAAREAAAHAHAPYSKFAVGAALLLSDGSVVTGTNFENASYGLSLCAETIALAKANGDGQLRNIVEIAVIGGVPNGVAVVRPCGRCRQMLNEAAQLGGRDIVIHCSSGDASIMETHRLSDLLPYAFGPADLADFT
jgi:cytidine deaminase